MVYISLGGKNASLYIDEFPFSPRKKKQPSINYYFLSHAHSDHTKGVQYIKYVPNAKIVCSRETAIFIQHLYGIPIKDKCLIISNNQSIDFDDFIVHALNANHCLGSLMFVIESKSGYKVVYTGDFRYEPEKFNEMDLVINSDVMWLDFTYGKNPKFKFPPREKVISDILSLILSKASLDMNSVWIATYQIGKETLLKTLSKALKTKIHASSPKPEMYRKISSEYDIFTSKPSSISVHSRNVIEKLRGADDLTINNIKNSLRISPTGWSAIRKIASNPNVFYFRYSDHNDFYSLHEWLEITKPKKIIYE